MTSKLGLALGVLAALAWSAAGEGPPVEVLPPAPTPAPVAPPMLPPGSSFQPPAVYAPSPAPCAPPAAPRRKLFHGRLRERLKTLLHLDARP